MNTFYGFSMILIFVKKDDHLKGNWAENNSLKDTPTQLKWNEIKS